MKRFLIALGVCAFLLVTCISMRYRGVQLSVSRVTDGSESYDYVADVPQVQILNDAMAQRLINERLRVIPERQKQIFLRDVKNLSFVQTGSTIKSNLTIALREGRVDDDIVSMLFVVSPYLFDAAHPNHFTIPFNYDVKAKKEIMFEDVIDQAKLPAFSALVSSKLIEQSKAADTYSEIKESFVRDGAGPKADNFRSFVIQPNGIDFYFDPYQAGPYAEGLLIASFSGGTLMDVLNEKGKALFDSH